MFGWNEIVVPLRTTEKTLDELKVLYQRSLFEWSRCGGLTDYSFLSEFMFSLRIVSCFLSFLLFVFFFLLVHHHEQLVLFLIFFINNSSLITYQKKSKISTFPLKYLGLPLREMFKSMEMWD